MIVTGVQPVGARGLNAVQATAVDPKDIARAATTSDPDSERRVPTRGEPQPVVFPRKGLPLDQRPVSLRQQHAAARYQSDGGDERDERDSHLL